MSAAAVEEEECVADAGSISQLSELSEFKLLDSSKMMSSLSSKHSALRVIRSGLIPPEDDPPPPPQQIPESSEPRLDWSKLDDVEIPADTMPLPIAESIPDVDFCNSTPQPEEEVPQELTGSALPHTAPNLRVSLSRNKLLDGSSERDRQGFSGGCPLPVLLALPASRRSFFFSADRLSADAPDALSDSNSGIF